MAIEKLGRIIVHEVQCLRCGYRWYPYIRDSEVITPKKCANVKCGSPLWNKPYEKEYYKQNRNNKYRYS